MPPSADNRRQTSDGADRHGAAAVTLQAIIQSDESGRRRGISPGESDDIGLRKTRDLRRCLGRIFLFNAIAELVVAETIAGQIIVVVQSFAENDVHHSKGEGGVRPWADRQPPIRSL